MFHAQVFQGLKGAVRAGGTGQLPPGACGGLPLPHLVGGVQLFLGEDLAGGANCLRRLLDLTLAISPPHLPSVITSGLNFFLLLHQHDQFDAPICPEAPALLPAVGAWLLFEGTELVIHHLGGSSSSTLCHCPWSCQ